MTVIRKSKVKRRTQLDPMGIDGKLIRCLEAFDAWRIEELWDYDYNSAKAAWMGAWFWREPKAG